MDNKLFSDLIEKYLANQCEPQEIQLINEWYRSHDTHENYLDFLTPEKKALLKNKMLQAIHERLNKEEDAGLAIAPALYIQKKCPVSLKRMLRVAAIIIVGGAASWLTYFFWPKPVRQYETAYGERNAITLPDGSKVVLNGHSTLRSNSNWSTSSAREVWLEGEAYFSVTHMKNHQEFVVHTSDGVSIEVLGTSFNVKKRSQGTQVVLKEGRIRLIIPDGPVLDSLTMYPGDLVEISGNTKKMTREVVKPERYTSWQNPQMDFSNTALRDILRMIQEVYGYEVVVTDPSLMDMRFSGSVPNDSVEILLQALRETLSCQIIQENNRLTISKN